MNSVYQPDNVFPKRRRAWRNDAYYIRREAILEALGLPDRIPVGETLMMTGVKVRTGWWLPRMGAPRPDDRIGEVTLTVFVRPHGVANRITVKCPECGEWMRFCGLAQHVGCKTCVARKAKNEKEGVRWG